MIKKLSFLFLFIGLTLSYKSQNTFPATGNIGIGTTSPQHPLDVVGDARISNNLFIGGAIITTQTVSISTLLNAGDVNVTSNLNVNGDANFNNNVIMGNNLQFGGHASNFGVHYTPGSIAAPAVLQFGPFLNGGSPPLNTYCNPIFGGGSPIVNQFGGLMQIYNSGPGPLFNYTGGTILDIGANSGKGYINNRYSPLYLNADCSTSLYMVTGGGSVGFGTSSPVERYHFDSGNLLVDSLNSSGINFRMKINGGIQPALQISSKNADAFEIIDANANVSNFKVKTNGTTYAREIFVTVNSFPDYVFAKEYTLPKLKEVKEFIQKNHRLANMPSAREVEKNGANIGEIQRITLEKLEESYLYIFQLEEKLERLNKKIELLEQKIK